MIKRKIFNKKVNETKDNFFEGTINKKDEITPAYINLQNPKFLEIDNLYYGGLIVVDYYREQADILLKTLIETNINMNISIFYERQDPFKTVKI